MTLQVEQWTEQVSERKWQWSVWIEGDDSELDSIEHVTYQLHETFVNPVVVISDRESNFKLDSSGWGQFVMYITIDHKDSDEPTYLEHFLEFNEYAPTRDGRFKRVSKDENAKKAFLSYSLIDSKAAKEVKKNLESSVKPGEDLTLAMERMIEESDFAVSVVSEISKNSPWADMEADTIKDNNKPFVKVTTDENDQLLDVEVVAEFNDAGELASTGISSMVVGKYQKLN